MNKFMNTLRNWMGSFVSDEQGAQVVEYALIIAVVSIALVIALAAMDGGAFANFITRVENCLTAGQTCA